LCDHRRCSFYHQSKNAAFHTGILLLLHCSPAALESEANTLLQMMLQMMLQNINIMLYYYQEKYRINYQNMKYNLSQFMVNDPTIDLNLFLRLVTASQHA